MSSNWGSIINQIKGDFNNLEHLKKENLLKLKEVTGRELICYYSAFLSRNVEGLEIRDQDMIGIMNAVHGLDREKGLDLILHTPGGDPAAAEHIVEYLRDVFNGNIRVIIPHMAMSAGTMIAFSANEIVMGRHSCLGPVDPQFRGLPAVNIVSSYNQAKSELATNPEHAHYWAIELHKYPSGMRQIAENSINLTDLLVRDWLKTGMFKGEDREDTINEIVEEFNDNKSSKIHGRHYSRKKCREFKLKITDLEDNQDIQDAVLTLHHCYSILMENSQIIKIIENGNGIGYMVQASTE